MELRGRKSYPGMTAITSGVVHVIADEVDHLLVALALSAVRLAPARMELTVREPSSVAIAIAGRLVPAFRRLLMSATWASLTGQGSREAIAHKDHTRVRE
jgi:hypothetical protein